MSDGTDGGEERGRPALRRRRNKGGERSHRTVIRHTDEEWNRVVARATHLGFSVPGFYEYAASQLPDDDDGRPSPGGSVAKPVGRRRRNPDGTREHRTVIRHTDEEWARITAASANLGMSVPEFYERAVWAGDAQALVEVSIIHDELWGVRRSLRTATNNINQIAKGVNYDGTFYEAQAVKALQLLADTIGRLSELLDPIERHSPGSGRS